MAEPFQVTVRVINWRAEVIKTWGEEWSKPDVAYEFSSGRKFDDTGERGGPYNQD